MPELNLSEVPDVSQNTGVISSKAAFWSYLDMLRRRVWVILTILILTTTIGLIKASRTPNIYRVKARLLVEQQAPTAIQIQPGYEYHAAYDPDFYNTQAELVYSKAVLEVALENPAISSLFSTGKEADTRKRLSSFASEMKRTVMAAMGIRPSAPPAPWELLREQVAAEHLPNTHFIELFSQHTDPYRATKMANEVARAYKDYHLRLQKEQLGATFSSLESEKAKEELALLEAEQELQKFREQAKTVSVGSTATPEDQPAIERLVKMNQQLTEVQLRRIELSAQIGVMREALDSTQSVSHALDERLYAIPVIQTDPELSRTRHDLAEAEKNLAVLVDTYGPSHPVLLGAQTNIVLLRDQFRNALREIGDSHENRLQMLLKEEADLQKGSEEQRKVTLNLAKEEFELTRIQGKVDRHRRVFDALVERIRQVDFNSGIARINVQITQEATLPTVPINAGKLQTIAFSIFLGLFLGVGLAFLFENLDDTIKTPEDLKERRDLPLLGFVPTIVKTPASGTEGAPETTTPAAGIRKKAAGLPRTALRELGNQTRLAFREMIPTLDKEEPDASTEDRRYRGSIVLAEPKSSIAEAYRSVRANLFYSRPAGELKLLSVTSCRPKEGKTTTSTNLAISIAQTGKRVLIIDGDLHRPSIHKALGVANERGLTNVLVGEATWRSVLQKAESNGHRAETLDILAAGPSSPSPSELLGSTRMQALLREVRAAYDWVIVDTPPVLFVTDASILSVLCDGVIVVVRAGFSTNTLLARTTEKLRDVRAHIIGGILNNVVVSRMGRHYSTYYNVGYSRYARDYHRSYYAGEGGHELDTEPTAAQIAPPVVQEPESAGPAAAGETTEALRAPLGDSRLQAGPWESERSRLQEQLASAEAESAKTKEALAELRQRHEELQAASTARERERAMFAERVTGELETLRAERNRAEEDRRAERARHLDETHSAQAQLRALESQVRAATHESERARREGELGQDGLRRSLDEAQGRADGLAHQLTDERARRRQIEDAQATTQLALERLTESLRLETRRRAELLTRAEAAEQALEALRQRPMPVPIPIPVPSPVAATPLAPTPAAVEAPRPVAVAAETAMPDFSQGRIVRAALHQADLHAGAGTLAQARALLEKLVAARPDQWDAWERLIAVLARQQDSATIETHAARFSGYEGRGHYLYALCWGYRAHLQGDQQAASVYFEQALKDEPKSHAALEALTRAAMARQDLSAARSYVDRLLLVPPDSAYAYYVKGSLEYAAGMQAQAEAAWRRSIQIARTPEALNDLALLLCERGNLADAETMARAAIDLNSQRYQGWDTLGTVLLKAGRREAAREALERVVALCPSNDHALVVLADLCAEGGDLERAVQLLKSPTDHRERLSPDEQQRLDAVRSATKSG